MNIISAAVALWSSVVMLSAAVGNFWHFALARVGVGVGEAGFSAVAQSLISDYHAPHERTRALSIFMLGITLGVVVSSLMGGWVNQLWGWRAAFVAAGLPGIILAALVKWTIQEPPRARAAQTVAATAQDRPSLPSILGLIWRKRTLRHLAIAMGIANTVSAGMLAWIAVFFIRNHGMQTGELGTWMAVVVGGGGSAGIWLGGYLTSRYGAQDERVMVRLMAAATALIVPTSVIVLWCPSMALALAALLPFKIALFFCYGPAFSLVQMLSPATTRATMASVFILIQVLAGGVIGTQLLGILSDALVPVAGDSGSALRWAMTLACPLALWAAVHFWLAGRSIREDLRIGEETCQSPTL